jgi:outer membrane protein assembly factor BamD (BamD/ComL family)
VEGTVVEPPAPQVIAQEQEGNSSTLARENALFREAAEAARSGDVERASALFEDLSQKHPTSPLAQTALVRRFRLLAKAGRREEARSDARRYLDTFPNGFAVAEARALRGEPTDAGRPKLEAEH